MIDLSIIYPAHNEEKRLPDTLEKTLKFIEHCARNGRRVECLVVENGSTDDTYQIACQFAAIHPEFQAVSILARGKGKAVKYGMLNTRGAWRAMMDVDLSMPIPQLFDLWPAPGGAAVAIASREASGAKRVNEPWHRHLTGRVFNTLTKQLLPQYEDTQCGFKVFRADAAEAIFNRVSVEGLAFDVECLFIAECLGLPVAEVGVFWEWNPDSRVRLVRDSLDMLFDILTINARKAQYMQPLPQEEAAR